MSQHERSVCAYKYRPINPTFGASTPRTYSTSAARAIGLAEVGAASASVGITCALYLALSSLRAGHAVASTCEYMAHLKR